MWTNRKREIKEHFMTKAAELDHGIAAEQFWVVII